MMALEPIRNFGLSGIAVGRDRVHYGRKIRLFEVLEALINTRSPLDGPVLTVDPFGDRIRDSMRKVGHNVVPSRIPEKLMAALAFHLSAPIFLPSLATAGTRRRIGKKMRGKKIEDVFGCPHLRLPISSLRLSAFARVIVRCRARSRQIFCPLEAVQGEVRPMGSFPLKSYNYPR